MHLCKCLWVVNTRASENNKDTMYAGVFPNCCHCGTAVVIVVFCISNFIFFIII